MLFSEILDGTGWAAIAPYPPSSENIINLNQDIIVSGPLVGQHPGNNFYEDYILARVNSARDAEIFVRPVSSDFEERAYLSDYGSIDIMSHRPLTMFSIDDMGFPDFDLSTTAIAVDGLGAIEDRYRWPTVANQRCEVNWPLVQSGSDCPSETMVSGSALTTEIRGQSYLIGMHVRGGSFVREHETQGLPNGFLASRHFCADYESVCGQPCANLSDLVDAPDTGVSFLETRLSRIMEACDNNWGACQTSAYSLALEARHGTAQVRRDPVLALELLRLAAQNGSALAHLDLALLHEADVADANSHANAVWQGIREARQRTVPDIRALFELADLVTPEADIAADHHIAALEGGLNTVLYRSADDWPPEVACALQQRLVNDGHLTATVQVGISSATQLAMEGLCQCSI